MSGLFNPELLFRRLNKMLFDLQSRQKRSHFLCFIRKYINASESSTQFKVILLHFPRHFAVRLGTKTSLQPIQKKKIVKSNAFNRCTSSVHLICFRYDTKFHPIRGKKAFLWLHNFLSAHLFV